MTKANELFDLSGRTAVITGGSRGLGLQIAEVLGDNGARLVISSRKETDLQDAKAHLEARGISVDYIVADNRKDDDLVALSDQSIAKLGRVDILVNNAGATWGSPAVDHAMEAWDKLMDLNVRSVFRLSQLIARDSMIPNGNGRILNLASIAGLKGNKGIVAYNTSKAAVVNLTRALAHEWGEHGITVNALAPGMFESKMTAGTLDALGRENVAAQNPLGRIGGSEDLKGAALLYCSDAGSMITGTTLAIDGGLTAI
ncbi:MULTISPECIES: SDR family oxidoreductase [unclassified Ruegeria]|uniref:SDR family oxidoreductase n=1 Tax=unclassified Ruegeria TaxID=2625375 RepID=UPI001489B41F|nr:MULTISPECIES: SDR family oxidoreductase [unclassified Ruegeria]